MTKSKDPAKELTVSELRALIRKMTGRVAVSHDPDVLRKRLQDLLSEKRLRDASNEERFRPRSVSMPESAQAAAQRIAAAEGIGFSGLVRKALYQYALAGGYKNELPHLEER